MNANEFIVASRYAKVSPCSFFGDIEHRVARVTMENNSKCIVISVQYDRSPFIVSRNAMHDE